MKNAYCVSTEQQVDMKSGVLRPKNAAILQARCASALSCSNAWKSSYPHRHVNVIALHTFVAATVKLQKFVINKPDFSPSEHSSNWEHQFRQFRFMSALRHA